MLTPTGIITPLRVNELIQRECFCMLYAQRMNFFRMNEGGIVQLPAPYITFCDFFFNIKIYNFLVITHQNDPETESTANATQNSVYILKAHS